MDFLKIFADMEELFEPFSDDQRGRLFSAMMAYAFRGEAPSFDGPERYVWPALRRHIDQCAEKQRAQEENGKKGGRPARLTKPDETKQNPTKPNETQQNPTKPNETQQNPTKPNETQQEQEQEHAQEHEQEQEQEQERVRVIGIDGSDLTQAEKDCEEAERLVARYMPASRSPLGIDPRVGAISEMISRHGAEAVGRAFREAVASDNRGGVSVAFVRAIVENGGRPRAAPDKGYQTRHYTAEEFRGMETDLSAELAELKAARAG